MGVCILFLNLPIIYDELKVYGYGLFADESDITLSIKNIRYFSKDINAGHSDYIYLAYSHELMACKNIHSIKYVLCIGDIDQDFLRNNSLSALYIQRYMDKNEEFEKVLRIFEKYNGWERDLTMSVFQRKPFKETFEIGATLLWNPISFEDMSITLIMNAGMIPENIKGSVWEDIISIGFAEPRSFSMEKREQFYNMIQNNHDYFFLSLNYYNDSQHLIVPVYSHGTPFGFLTMSDICTHITQGQVSIITYLRDILEYALENSEELSQLYETNHYFAVRILNGEEIKPQTVTHHLSLRGWKMDDIYRVFFFSCPKEEVIDQGQSQYYCSLIMKEFDDVMQIPYDYGILAISHGTWNEIERSNLYYSLEKMGLFVGVSMDFGNFMDLKYAYLQSKAAIKQGKLQSPEKYVFEFADYYCNHIIYSLKEVTSLMSLCNLKLLQLAMSGEAKELDYINSLRMYLLNGFNLSTTAAKLYIHRNTLSYRLKRFEKLLGLDLTDLSEEEFLSLYLTCIIIDHL